MRKPEAEEMAARMNKLRSVRSAKVVPVVIQWAGAPWAIYDVEVTVTDPVFYRDLKNMTDELLDMTEGY